MMIDTIFAKPAQKLARFATFQNELIKLVESARRQTKTDLHDSVGEMRKAHSRRT